MEVISWGDQCMNCCRESVKALVQFFKGGWCTSISGTTFTEEETGDQPFGVQHHSHIQGI